MKPLVLLLALAVTAVSATWFAYFRQTNLQQRAYVSAVTAVMVTGHVKSIRVAGRQLLCCFGCIAVYCHLLPRASLLLWLQASAQPSWLTNLPGPPETCPAEVIRSIQWGTATSAYQVQSSSTHLNRLPQHQHLESPQPLQRHSCTSTCHCMCIPSRCMLRLHQTAGASRIQATAEDTRYTQHVGLTIVSNGSTAQAPKCATNTDMHVLIR